MTTCWVCSESLPSLPVGASFSPVAPSLLKSTISLDAWPHLPKGWRIIQVHQWEDIIFLTIFFMDGHLTPTWSIKVYLEIWCWQRQELSLLVGSQTVSAYFGLPGPISPNKWLEPAWKRQKVQNHEMEIKIEIWSHFSSPWIKLCPKLSRLPYKMNHQVLFSLVCVVFLSLAPEWVLITKTQMCFHG